MPRAVLLFVLLLFAGVPSFCQTPQGPSAPVGGITKGSLLKELSGSLEGLVTRAGTGIVQIFSTAYTLGGSSGDDEQSTGTGLLSRQRATGSGVIVSSDGYIVTNAHVVRGAREIQVRLSPGLNDTQPQHSAVRRAGKLVKAKVVGVDRETDLAVLKIDQTGLPTLRLGDSEALRQGQLVLAFGSPMGLQNSVTLGVISSTARQLRPDDAMIYIQTDAPINPGNSGGPLINTDGQVVGINTFILTQSGGSEGLGFAIPSNIVRTVFRQIRKSGHVHRGQIGVYAQTITPEMAAGLGLHRDWGVLLCDVEPDGPADQAGLEVGDIVLSLDGKIMENARQLEVNIYRRPIGEKVNLQILRGEQRLAIEVPVIERPNDPSRFADLVTPEGNLVTRLGILGVAIDKQIATMLPDLRKQYGVLVAARASDAPYSGDDLEPGDVIYSVNGTPVTSIDALRHALDGIPAGKPAVLQVERSGRLMFIAIEFE